MQTLPEYITAVAVIFTVFLYVVSLLYVPTDTTEERDIVTAEMLLQEYARYFVPIFTEEEKVFFARCYRKLECRDGYTHLEPEEMRYFTKLSKRKNDYLDSIKPPKLKPKKENRHVREEAEKETDFEKVTIIDFEL